MGNRPPSPSQPALHAIIWSRCICSEEQKALSDEMAKPFEVIKKHWPVGILTAVMAGIYSLYSLLRHHHFGSGGFDLGIFDQAVWHYSRLEAPASTTLGLGNMLGNHFSPILAGLALLYWFFDSAGVLLVTQGILFAVAIIPIWLFVKKRLGTLSAYSFALAYAIFWGVQNAIGYDFHEIAFAVPLIAFAIYFMDEGNWRNCFICLFLLLLTKEDLPLLVAFFGIYFLIHKCFKQGIIALAAGMTSFFLITKFIIPYFTKPDLSYVFLPYLLKHGFFVWTYDQIGSDPSSAIKTIMTSPLTVLRILVEPRVKIITALKMFYPFGLLEFFSPLMILTIPLMSERFLSTCMNYWGRNFHYTATISPILAMASADGLWNLSKVISHRQIRKYSIAAASIVVLSLNVRSLPHYCLWSLMNPRYYINNSNDNAGYAALKVIPAEGSVVAQDVIIPHLSHRQKIYQLNLKSPDADYVIASKSLPPWPMDSYDQVEQYLKQEEKRGYRVEFSSYGWTVLKRQTDLTEARLTR
jgi:uncharacterized membrane protein